MSKKKPKTVKIRLNAPLRGYLKDTELTIQADENSIPSDKYWRDRLTDSAIDNCVEIISSKKPKAVKEKAETKKKGEKDVY
jgi:hypothetical protein